MVITSCGFHFGHLVHHHWSAVRAAIEALRRSPRIDVLVRVTSALLTPINVQNSLWQVCGRNKWKLTGNRWERM